MTVSDDTRALDGFEALAALIWTVPFFRSLERVSCARLIGALEEVTVPAGTVLALEGGDADALYLIETGEVSVTVRTPEGERVLGTLRGPAYFGEMGLLLGRRTASVHAASDIRAWRLSRERFEQIVRQQPSIAMAVATTLAELLDQRARQYAGAPVVARESQPLRFEPPPAARPRIWRMLGFALTIGVPAVLWGLSPPSRLNLEGWHVLLVVLGAAIGWLLEPVPDFVIALAVPAAWGIAGLVTPAAALAGFSTPAWFMALGALGLAAAMLRSGLLLRIALRLLRVFPSTHFGQMLALLASGVVITPLLPLGLARVAAIAPLTQELAESLGYPPRSRARAGLLFAGLVGHTAFSPVFLTGLVMNFFVLDLLPSAERAHFGWVTWLASAVPAGVIILVGAILTLRFGLHPEVAPRTGAETRRRQEAVLGPISRDEQVTLAAIGILMAGLVFQPVLHVDLTWPAVVALIVLIVAGTLNRQDFRASIDWGFLALFGVLLGTGGVMRQVGIDRWIAGFLAPLAQAAGSPELLLVILAVLVVVGRLVLPWIPATLLLSVALVPVGPRIGLSAWTVGFVVLAAANTWLHPRQSDVYRLAREMTKGEMSTDAQGFLVGAAMTVATLLGIAACTPYWRALGLLGR